MNFLFTSLLSFLFTLTLFAQRPNEIIPRYLIGVESQIYFENLDAPGSTFGNYAFGLHVQKPMGRFNFGLGLQQQRFGQHEFRESTGQVTDDENLDDTWYIYQVQDRNIRFWSIPVQAQFRLPCNCVYIHTALIGSFLDRRNASVQNSYTEPRILAPETNRYFSFQDVRRASLGFQVGMGLNLHMSKQWKLTTRLMYSQYSFVDGTFQWHKYLGNSYLGLNAAIQYAIY